MGDVDIDVLIRDLELGKLGAEDRLYQAIYPILRRIAGRHMRGQPVGHTLQPTDLVSEAYLKLVRSVPASWESRAHILAVASKAMWQALVDRARGKQRGKRSAPGSRVELDVVGVTWTRATIPLLDLDAALVAFRKLDPRAADAVTMTLGGMTADEIAAHFGIAKRTVQRDITSATAWLRDQLT